MRLNDDVELGDGSPIIYIRSLSLIACADLHLGYEGVLAKEGVFLPKYNLSFIENEIKKAIERYKPKQILIDGDIKNEFSKVYVEEFNEFMDFMKFLNYYKVKVILVKGNHDNFIDRLKEPLGFEMYKQEHLIKNYLFFHGEELPKSKKGNFLIMGHVHPAIAIYNAITKEKLRCFLYGRFNGKEILILPALSYYAEGVEVNNLANNLNEISPIFNIIDFRELEAYCLGEDETLYFGKIKDLVF